MKAIAIVELPDDAFDDEAWGDGKWIIDDEGAIRYKEDDAWMHYKDIDVDGIELRPLPEKVDFISSFPEDPYDWTFLYLEAKGYEEGWNACLDEILGENNE